MRGVSPAASAALRSAVQCTIDFLFDDNCHLCGRRAERAGEGGPALDVIRGAVAAAVRVGWATNHPVCSDCASRLQVAAGEGVLGWCLPGGSILMTSGELVAAPENPQASTSPGPVCVHSAFCTEATLLQLIHLIKFSRLTSLVGGLADALALAAGPAARRLDRDPTLVPVPMDARSRRRRGFNQAERIAAKLGQHWMLPLRTDAVVKPRPTPPQSLTRRDARMSNVRAAFRPGPGQVAGRDVILVDDLVTTGATAAAVAAVLAARGAASVTVASVGRAL